MSPNRALFTWTFPGCPVEIDLSLGVVETIQRVSIEKGTSDAKQGVLLGDIVNGRTRITGFLPAADIGEEMSVTARSAARGAIGFFRVRPGGSLELAEDETAAARSMFQRPGGVVLLIQPRKTGAAEATFFFFERNLLCGGYLHFPFDATFLSERELRVIPSAPALRHTPLAAIPASQPRQPRRWRKAFAMTSVAVLAMAGGAALTQAFHTPPPPNNIIITPLKPTPANAGNLTRIEMGAEREGKDLKITWDQALGSPGSSATLAIVDGATHRILPLERDQLSLGSVLHMPVSDEIRVEMAISHGTVVDARGGLVVLVNPRPPAR